MKRIFSHAGPASFYPLAGRLVPWCAMAAITSGLLGLYIALLVAPADFQQGNAYRIIFIHVPAAWMSMIIYLAMALWSAVGLVLNTRLSHMMAQALAPTGAMMTLLALVTGALWGKPTWGAWWVWDARLTSELLLLFLYAGYISLAGAIEDTRRADKAAALLAMVGAINIPVIYFSVRWWNTLHQGASVSMSSAPKMAQIMVLGMLLMVCAFWMYTVAVALLRLRAIILRREGPRVRLRQQFTDSNHGFNGGAS